MSLWHLSATWHGRCIFLRSEQKCCQHRRMLTRPMAVCVQVTRLELLDVSQSKPNDALLQVRPTYRGYASMQALVHDAHCANGLRILLMHGSTMQRSRTEFSSCCAPPKHVQILPTGQHDGAAFISISHMWLVFVCRVSPQSLISSSGQVLMTPP